MGVSSGCTILVELICLMLILVSKTSMKRFLMAESSPGSRSFERLKMMHGDFKEVIALRRLLT